MKKLFLTVCVVLTSCVNEITDPLDFKGCVIDNKTTFMGFTYYTLKLLPDSLREKYGRSYMKIEVTNREFTFYEIGDTIK